MITAHRIASADCSFLIGSIPLQTKPQRNVFPGSLHPSSRTFLGRSIPSTTHKALNGIPFRIGVVSGIGTEAITGEQLDNVGTAMRFLTVLLAAGTLSAQSGKSVLSRIAIEG